MPQSPIRDDGNFAKNFSFPLTQRRVCVKRRRNKGRGVESVRRGRGRGIASYCCLCLAPVPHPIPCCSSLSLFLSACPYFPTIWNAATVLFSLPATYTDTHRQRDGQQENLLRAFNTYTYVYVCMYVCASMCLYISLSSHTYISRAYCPKRQPMKCPPIDWDCSQLTHTQTLRHSHTHTLTHIHTHSHTFTHTHTSTHRARNMHIQWGIEWSSTKFGTTKCLGELRKLLRLSFD